MNYPVEIAPSILAADFSCLGEGIRAVESGGAGLLHVDVMDGHFVPNISIGIPVVASLRKATRLPLGRASDDRESGAVHSRLLPRRAPT